jgi:hypothetical protein
VWCEQELVAGQQGLDMDPLSTARAISYVMRGMVDGAEKVPVGGSTELVRVRLKIMGLIIIRTD